MPYFHSMSRVRSMAVGVIFTLLLVLSARVASAGDEIGRVPFRHYGADDGLPVTSLFMGVQDGIGYTWVAGTGGLARYDGHRFRRYGLEDGLPSQLVTDLAVAPDGRLWGATAHGAFYASGDALVAFGGGVLPENGTHQIAFDARGAFWVTTTVGPFVMPVGGKLELLPTWPGGDSFAITFEPDGTLFIGQGARVLRRSPRDTELVDVGQDFGGTVTAIVRDGAGRLWLRAGARLWSQPSAGGPFEDRSVDYLGALPGPYPRRLSLDVDRALLIPSTLGLIRVDDRGAHFVVSDLPPDATSLRDAWVDREGSLWLAGAGLHRRIGRGLWRKATTSDALPSNAVWGIRRAANGTLVVATETGAVKEVNGRFEPLPGIEMAGYVTEGPPNVLWFGGEGRIVAHDLATSTSRAFGAEAGLPPVPVLSTVADGRGTLWVALDSAGVYRAPLAGLVGGGRPPARFERVALPDGAATEMVSKILDDGERVWLATNHGLYVETPVPGGWRRLTTADGLRSDAPSLLTRHHHELCVSYAARTDLTCFGYAGGALQGLHHRDVPGKLVPEALGEDARHRLWIGTTRGVTVVDGERIDHFSRAAGAPGDDTNFDTFMAEPDGTVWIGASSGLGRFDGARYHGPPPAPVVSFVSGVLAGRPLDFAAPPRDAVPYESVLTMHFSAMSNIDERHIEHQVKLSGYDDDWQAADAREVQYQKLPGGAYRFEVRARRPDGPWGPPTSFDFEVRHAFWQRWWFRVIVATLAMLAIVCVTRWRMHALERRNANLERTVEQRTSELRAHHDGARRILDAVEQGLFTVMADGTIEPEISAAARAWFGAPVEGQRVWEWLPGGDPNASRWLKVGWETYQEDFMPQEVVLDQLPTRFRGGERTYALRWLPNDTSNGALVVATDITETLETERAERARGEQMASLRKLLEDRSGFLEFLGEAERMLAALCGPLVGSAIELRVLHTLKGNSSFFALDTFSQVCHDLETTAQERSLSDEDRARLNEAWASSTAHLRPFVDVGAADAVSVPLTELGATIDALASSATRDEIARRLERWRLEPARVRLARLAGQAGRLGRALGKGELEITIDDHGVRLPQERLRSFWSTLVHVIRNAVDHGIEPEAVRRAAGKPVAGRIDFETKLEDGEVVVSIRDDGRGIDWSMIAELAADHGMPCSTQDDLVEALFSEGFSTADALTAVSGRGVGTSATRAATLALGGRIVVRSEPGCGTSFEFRFPASAIDAVAAPTSRAA